VAAVDAATMIEVDVVADEARTSYTPGASKTSKSGLCTTLGNNVFDYGHKKAAADQMRTSWEKLV
jgi:hypothetical protein